MPKLGLRTLGAIAVLAAAVMIGSGQAALAQDKVKAVSYTHLTLPTNREV